MARSVVLAMNSTLDGYVAGPAGELDWLWPTMDPAQVDHVLDFLETVDTILIGHHTYLEQAAHWPDQPSGLADLLNAHTKIVFSSRLESLEWNNSHLATADAATEVKRLKQRTGKNIYVTGGATLARSLTRLGLIDEYRITVHPVLLGAGRRLFGDVPGIARLTRVSVATYDSGAIEVCYRRA